MQFKLSAPLLSLISLAAIVPTTHAGLIAYGICQTGGFISLTLPQCRGSTERLCAAVGCNTVTVACYAGAGFVFGTVTAGVGTPAAIVACNVALGQCSAACALIALTPTP